MQILFYFKISIKPKRSMQNEDNNLQRININIIIKIKITFFFNLKNDDNITVNIINIDINI